MVRGFSEGNKTRKDFYLTHLGAMGNRRKKRKKSKFFLSQIIFLLFPFHCWLQIIFLWGKMSTISFYFSMACPWRKKDIHIGFINRIIILGGLMSCTLQPIYASGTNNPSMHRSSMNQPSRMNVAKEMLLKWFTTFIKIYSW